MANSVTLQEFYERQIYDRFNGTPDTNALDILIGTGHAFTIDITGTPTGGTFKLQFGDQETTDIAHNSNAAAIDGYITALSNVGASDVAVTGTSPNFTAVFSGDSRFTRERLTLSDNSLTGGTSPSVSIAVTPASDNTLLSLMNTVMSSTTTEFSNDAEEDRVQGEAMDILGEFSASILANVK